MQCLLNFMTYFCAGISRIVIGSLTSGIVVLLMIIFALVAGILFYYLTRRGTASLRNRSAETQYDDVVITRQQSIPLEENQNIPLEENVAYTTVESSGDAITPRHEESNGDTAVTSSPIEDVTADYEIIPDELKYNFVPPPEQATVAQYEEILPVTMVKNAAYEPVNLLSLQH